VPVLIALYLVAERRRMRRATAFASPELLPGVVDRSPQWRRHLPLAVLLVAFVLLIVGVARPHAVVSEAREDATVMLVIDTSRSMSATDVQPTRLGAARGAAEAFLRSAPKKFRVGIVAFASLAVVTLPPTADRALAAESLATLRPGEGTALGDAIVLAADLGQKERADDGTVPPTSILLISDGAPDGGEVEPLQAARRAKELGIPVFTVAVGTPDGVVEVPLEGGFTQRISVPPQPERLQEIASATGGEFFTATDPESLRAVYENLGSRLGSRDVDREVTNAFAGGAVLFLILGGALSALWLRRTP
jgi:Ca-activated chloride channel homolog